MAKSKSASSPPDSRHLSDQLDRKLASAAYRKVMTGETPTSQEKAALKRFEKEQEEQKRWQFYETIPQKHWRQMSGRQTKVLNEQAERYGIPFGGRTINLPNVVRALHDFLATHARRLMTDEDDLLSGDVSSPALERYRDERAKLAKLDRLEREKSLIPRDEIHEGFGRVASILRTAGETLQRQYGNGAVEVLNDALDDAVSAVEQMCGDGDTSDSEPAEES